MKRVVILAVLIITLSAVSRADTIVSVNMEPTTYPLFKSSVTIGVTFLWDITTGILSGFEFTQSGLAPFSSGSQVAIIGHDLGPSHSTGLSFLSFLNTAGDGFQLNYDIHAFLIPLLGSTPGTYITDLDFQCGGQDCIGSSPRLGLATVTPVTTPEPGVLLMFSAGLVGLVLLKRGLS